MPEESLEDLLVRVPVGWTEVAYDGARWGMSRVDAAGGRAISVYAERLGGARPRSPEGTSTTVSTNVYLTSDGPVLKPCEMPAERVLDFLRRWRTLGSSA